MSDTELRPVRWLRGEGTTAMPDELSVLSGPSRKKEKITSHKLSSNFYTCPMAGTCSCIISTFKIQYKNSGFYVLFSFAILLIFFNSCLVSQCLLRSELLLNYVYYCHTSFSSLL